jgi:hypothetical protein
VTTNKKVYPWKTRLGTDYTGETIRRRDGHVIKLKRVTATCIHAECARPEKKFDCVITTKPPYYCPECAVVVAQERRKRDKEKYVARRKRTGANGGRPKRRLIRYAGYDGKETEYE